MSFSVISKEVHSRMENIVSTRVHFRIGLLRMQYTTIDNSRSIIFGYKIRLIQIKKTEINLTQWTPSIKFSLYKNNIFYL